MLLTKDKALQGYSTKQYFPNIKVNKNPVEDIYEAVTVPIDVLSYFDNLESPLTLVVFHAEWCGDAITTTPTILKLADTSSNLTPYIFNRDEEVDLTNQFLPEHRANTVPVFVVLDAEFNEVARFIETAKGLIPMLDAMNESIHQQTSEDSENRALIRGKRTSYRVMKANEWGSIILKEFQETVATGLNLAPDKRPAEGGTEWPV